MSASMPPVAPAPSEDARGFAALRPFLPFVSPVAAAFALALVMSVMLAPGGQPVAAPAAGPVIAADDGARPAR